MNNEELRFRTLWRGVIYQALYDASYNSSEVEREEARWWFFSSLTSVVDDFEEVCGLAGLPEAKVKRAATKILITKEQVFDRRSLHTLLNLDEEENEG